MTQHKGDLVVTNSLVSRGQITGTTYVRSGGTLIVHGQLAGGLVIDEGGEATIHGQVARNVVNNGRLTVLGQIVGRVIGNPPINPVGPDQIVGLDLEVPFRATTRSYDR